MQEAILYRKLKNNKVQCWTCCHYCVIAEGQRGKCGVRENKDGKLYSLVYAKPCAINIDPIEKKPFFHFLPGTQSLSIATVGCNFSCLNCQNWQISQTPKISEEIESVSFYGDRRKVIQNLPKERGIKKKVSAAEKEILQGSIPCKSPAEIVEMALENKLPSISYTYTEPTVFLEYALDTMKLAKKAGLKNAWVSNGFFSQETFELIKDYLDAANIDLKGFGDEFYQKVCGALLQPVLDNLKRLKKAGVWLEITTLAIPSLSDSEAMFEGIAQFIRNELGQETAWHISQFSGAISWKLRDLPETPIETLKTAWQIAKKAGLKYVYTGNVPGLDSEDTYCPKCQAKMIERNGYLITRFDKDGKCSKCGEDLNLILS